jgi:hypothetical protein
MAGPNAPNIAIAQQAASAQDASINILSRILTTTETEVGYLAQIRAELGRQTAFLTGVPSPEGAPAVGMGLSSNVSPISSGRGETSWGMPYSGSY